MSGSPLNKVRYRLHSGCIKCHIKVVSRKMTSNFSTGLLVQQRHFTHYFRSGSPLIKKSFWLLLKIENQLQDIF